MVLWIETLVIFLRNYRVFGIFNTEKSYLLITLSCVIDFFALGKYDTSGAPLWNAQCYFLYTDVDLSCSTLCFCQVTV